MTTPTVTPITDDAHDALVDAITNIMHLVGGDTLRLANAMADAEEIAQSHYAAERQGA